MGERRGVRSKRRVLIIASEPGAREAIRAAVLTVPSCQVAAEARTVHQATMLLTRGTVDAVVVHAPVLSVPEAAVLRWTLRRAGVTAIVVLDNGLPPHDGDLLARIAIACGVHDLHTTLERLGPDEP